MCGCSRSAIACSSSIVRRAAKASPETHLVDFIGDICPDEVCRAVIGNALVYRDKDHLTATFARTLEPMLESDFREDGLL